MPMLLRNLMGSGLPPQMANVMAGDITDNQTATGTTQATALVTGTAIIRVTTTASGTGVRLQDSIRGDSQIIINDGASTLSVYPPGGHLITGYATNAAFSITAGAWAYFERVTNTRWIVDNDAANSMFLPSGSGAQSRTVQAKLREIVSITDFLGVTYDGVTDDLSAINTAISNNPGKAFYFPGGFSKVSGAITITGDGTRLYGAGSNDTTIINSSLTAHGVKFYPNNTATTTTFINNCAIAGIGISSAVDKTAGAGIYALQCNRLSVVDVKIGNHPEGLLVSGGQLNVLDKLYVFASSSVLTGTPVSNSQALRFCEAPITGGLFQDCFTCEVSNLIVSGSRVLDKGIRVESCDGLHFTNGYVNGAYSDEVFIKVLTASRYVAGLKFTSMYIDGVSMTTAPTGRNGVSIPSSAVGNVYSVHFDNCQIANYTGKGCLVAEDMQRLTFTGGTEFLNIDSWAIDVTGSNTLTELVVTGCNFKDVGEVTINKGGISVNTVLNTIITSNTFTGIGNTGATAISTAGTNANAQIDDTAFIGNTANITDTATWTGNASGFPIAWTPTLTFATPGDQNIAYTTQFGRSIRKGSLCTVSFVIQTSTFTHSTAAGNLQVTGMPVTSTTATQVSDGSLAFNGITKANYTNFTLRVSSSATLCFIEASGSAQAISTVAAADTPSGGTLILHGEITYECLP